MDPNLKFFKHTIERRAKTAHQHGPRDWPEYPKSNANEDRSKLRLKFKLPRQKQTVLYRLSFIAPPGFD
ncbi:hypothetical protein BQ8794_40308 [Mesorhizobium prunaredense]|uniref:Uncharacterized protein n=1 Tax=Mesorhizobium prunaredense TaxID=1631249 RepID=A0A1R3VCP8_9HYPH|nr:hypothetical protein BQ8794_40308 [Mesorhizobium prunaredense]